MHRQPSTAFSLSRVGMYDNIAVSFLPNCESLSKNALEKGLNYFTQGYIHDIKILEAHGDMRLDARCWRSMRESQDPHNLHVEIGDDKLPESYCTCKIGYVNLLYFCCFFSYSFKANSNYKQ